MTINLLKLKENLNYNFYKQSCYLLSLHNLNLEKMPKVKKEEIETLSLKDMAVIFKEMSEEVDEVMKNCNILIWQQQVNNMSPPLFPTNHSNTTLLDYIKRVEGYLYSVIYAFRVVNLPVYTCDTSTLRQVEVIQKEKEKIEAINSFNEKLKTKMSNQEIVDVLASIIDMYEFQCMMNGKFVMTKPLYFEGYIENQKDVKAYQEKVLTYLNSL